MRTKDRRTRLEAITAAAYLMGLDVESLRAIEGTRGRWQIKSTEYGVVGTLLPSGTLMLGGLRTFSAAVEVKQ